MRTQTAQRHVANRCVLTLIRPVRLFQFITVLLLFLFMVYTIFAELPDRKKPLTALSYIILIVISGVYVFILAIEMITYLTGGILHVIPMIVFSFVGLFFFGISGIMLIVSGYASRTIAHVVITTLAVIVTLLFLIDLAMVLSFWHRRCAVCAGCCEDSSQQTRQLQRRARMSQRAQIVSVPDSRCPKGRRNPHNPHNPRNPHNNPRNPHNPSHDTHNNPHDSQSQYESQELDTFDLDLDDLDDLDNPDTLDELNNPDDLDDRYDDSRYQGNPRYDNPRYHNPRYEPDTYDTNTSTPKHDATTSVSDVRMPGVDGGATPDHSYRKIGNPRRRQYVDCPTCPSSCNLDVAQIQTENTKTSVVESQTPLKATKETPMQTLSKCEFCERQMQPYAPPTIIAGQAPPVAQCFQHPPPQWTSAIVQFVQRGEGVPCCAGCKCVKETQQRATAAAEDTITRTCQTQPKTLTKPTDKAPKVSGIAANSKKLDVIPSKPDKRMSSTKTHSSMQDTRVQTDAKSKDKEIKTEPVTETEKRWRRKPSATSVASEGEKSGGKLCKLFGDKKKKKEKPVESDVAVKKSKEEEIRYEKCPSVAPKQQVSCQDSAVSAVENDDEHILTQTVSTQVSMRLIPSNKVKQKMFLLHLKNKVKPSDDEKCEDIQVGDEATGMPKIIHITRCIQNEPPSESQGPVEYPDICICDSQKNIKTTSNPSNPSNPPKRHATLFMSKDEYYCEFCRPNKYSDMVSRCFEAAELKKLRCASCKTSLYERSTEACPICFKKRATLSSK